MTLSGRAALVTGASRGLGAEVARRLSEAGAAVAVTYSDDEGAAEALVGELESEGGAALALKAAAEDFERAGEVVAAVRERFGGLDALVCNAGVSSVAPLIEISEEDWDRDVDVSLKGAFNYIRAAGPGFAAQGGGKIVCVGSINGLRGRVGTAAYNTAKAGLVGLVKTAAAELGPAGVNANLVAPGFVETPAQADTPPLVRDLVVKETALKRLGTPEDVAPLIVFLCSDAARHITGQTIQVDAGQYL